MTKSNKVTITIVKDDAYRDGDEPFKAGDKVKVSKTEARKLKARGIAE